MENNGNKLKLYSRLSQFKTLRQSYSRKVMVIAFLGLNIPLLTLIIYLSVSSRFNDNLGVLIVIFVATIVSSIATFLLLEGVLYPITLTSKAVHSYMNGARVPNLPVNFEDSVGQLMTSVQYTIEKLEFLNHTQETNPGLDSLTGIPNRFIGETRLRQDLARLRRDGGPGRMLVALLDIDDFKKINEQFGTQVGDVCLVQIAELLSKSIRQGDWLARWGGDKFLMVLWNFNHKNAAEILDRIRQKSLKTPMGELLQINLNVGAYECDGSEEAETVIAKAEYALQEVRKRERGGISVADIHSH